MPSISGIRRGRKTSLSGNCCRGCVRRTGLGSRASSVGRRNDWLRSARLCEPRDPTRQLVRGRCLPADAVVPHRGGSRWRRSPSATKWTAHWNASARIRRPASSAIIPHPKLTGLRRIPLDAPFGRFLVFYRVTADEVRAARLLHGMRDLPRRLLDPPGSE